MNTSSKKGKVHPKSSKASPIQCKMKQAAHTYWTLGAVGKQRDKFTVTLSMCIKLQKI